MQTMISKPTKVLYTAQTHTTGNRENGASFLLQARLNIHLPGLDREVALSLVEAAQSICPYSKAIRGNIDVEYNLI